MSDRIYEILFIADPNLGEPEVDALTAIVQGFVEKEGGQASRRSRSGARSASPTSIGKHREGSYVLLVVEGKATLVKEVERRIRVTDGVIKFMTVRVDEELRKAERPQGAARRGRREAQARAGRPCAPRPGAALGRRDVRGGGSCELRWWRCAAAAAAAAGGGGRGGGRAARRRGGPGGKDAGKRYFFRRRKVCKFCADKIDYVDYKDVKLLSGVRARAGQGPAAADVRHLRRAPAQADAGHQAGAQHRAPAFRAD